MAEPEDITEQPFKARAYKKTLEIAVDNCAQLAGAPFRCIEALKTLEDMAGFRDIRYVDVAQGIREKGNIASVDMLDLFTDIGHSFATFLKRNADWVDIHDTDQCQAFMDTMTKRVIPEGILPVLEAAEKASKMVRTEAYRRFNKHHMASWYPKEIHSADGIELVFSEKPDRKGRYHMDDPLLKAATSFEEKGKDTDVCEGWHKIVRKNQAMKNNSGNMEKGTMLSLLRQNQEVRAFTYFILWHTDREAAEALSPAPDIIHALTPPLSSGDIRSVAHLFADIPYPITGRDQELSPSVQRAVTQGLRMANLWPHHLQDMLHEKYIKPMSAAHRNCADRAYQEYYLNTYPDKEDAEKRHFVLVTQDAPLIAGFVAYKTGVRELVRKKKGVKPAEECEGDVPSHKKREHGPVSDEDYEFHGYTRREEKAYGTHSILTGDEFIRFLERERLRLLQHLPQTDEAHGADLLLQENIRQLRQAVKDDKMAQTRFKHELPYAQRVFNAHMAGKELNERG